MTRNEYGFAYCKGLRLTIQFLCSRGLSIDAAEENAQAAWAKGWERLGQLRDSNMVFVWMNSVALKIHRAQLRREPLLDSMDPSTKRSSPRLNLSRQSRKPLLRELRSVAEFIVLSSEMIAYQLSDKPGPLRARFEFSDLPAGAKITIVGAGRLPNMSEVEWQGRSYFVFNDDLAHLPFAVHDQYLEVQNRLPLRSLVQRSAPVSRTRISPERATGDSKDRGYDPTRKIEATIDAHCLLQLCQKEDRRVLRRRYLEGYEVREIPSLDGATEAEVKKRLQKARMAIRRASRSITPVMGLNS